MKPPSEYKNTELDNLIANYRRLHKTDEPYFVDLLEEMNRRKGNGLQFETTMRAVLTAAKNQEYISYKRLADANDVEWSKVRYAMNQHLRDLIEFAHRKGWPLISAIVVNQKNVETGKMDATSLSGFVSAAKELGYVVTGEETFLKEQQARVFEWASAFENEDSP